MSQPDLKVEEVDSSSSIPTDDKPVVLKQTWADIVTHFLKYENVIDVLEAERCAFEFSLLSLTHQDLHTIMNLTPDAVIPPSTAIVPLSCRIIYCYYTSSLSNDDVVIGKLGKTDLVSISVTSFPDQTPPKRTLRVRYGKKYASATGLLFENADRSLIHICHKVSQLPLFRCTRQVKYLKNRLPNSEWGSFWCVVPLEQSALSEKSLRGYVGLNPPKAICNDLIDWIRDGKTHALGTGDWLVSTKKHIDNCHNYLRKQFITTIPSSPFDAAVLPNTVSISHPDRNIDYHLEIR